MTHIPALIALLEKATRQDRELDGLIAKLIGEMPEDAEFNKPDMWGESHGSWARGGFGAYQFFDPPEYTASVDAVAAMLEEVLPGWDWSVHKHKQGEEPSFRDAWAGVRALPIGPVSGVMFDACGHAPPIALLIAALKAMSRYRPDLKSASGTLNTNGESNNGPA